jgi:biotin synthase
VSLESVSLTSVSSAAVAAPAQPVTVHRPAKVAGAAPEGGWSVSEVQALLDLPFSELMHRARTVHRAHFPEGDVELATLLSVKTGGCPENCGYCPQAAQYDTGVTAQKLMEVDEVLRNAQAAKDAGATRFAWERPGVLRRTAMWRRWSSWWRR